MPKVKTPSPPEAPTVHGEMRGDQFLLVVRRAAPCRIVFEGLGLSAGDPVVLVLSKLHHTSVPGAVDGRGSAVFEATAADTFSVTDQGNAELAFRRDNGRLTRIMGRVVFQD